MNNLKNNIKSQYQLYFGWFDGHPSNINRLTPKKEGAKLIEYMGQRSREIALNKYDVHQVNKHMMAEMGIH